MNKLTRYSSTLFLCTGLAFVSMAQAHDHQGPSRAEVRAELNHYARINSEDSAAFVNQYDGIGERPSRHQVRDELEIAKMNGEFARLNSENSSAFAAWLERDHG